MRQYKRSFLTGILSFAMAFSSLSAYAEVGEKSEDDLKYPTTKPKPTTTHKADDYGYQDEEGPSLDLGLTFLAAAVTGVLIYAYKLGPVNIPKQKTFFEKAKESIQAIPKNGQVQKFAKHSLTVAGTVAPLALGRVLGISWPISIMAGMGGAYAVPKAAKIVWNDSNIAIAAAATGALGYFSGVVDVPGALILGSAGGLVVANEKMLTIAKYIGDKALTSVSRNPGFYSALGLGVYFLGVQNSVGAAQSLATFLGKGSSMVGWTLSWFPWLAKNLGLAGD